MAGGGPGVVAKPRAAATAGSPWNEPLSALLASLGANGKGLTAGEASRRLDTYGPNDGASWVRRPLWLQVVDRLSNPLVLILLFASALSAWTGEIASFVIIAALIGLSVVLDLVQQGRAEAAVETLRQSVALRATAVRDGREAGVPAETLVPGDVVRLAAGDVVPADCRLIAARDLFINQAQMTGESFPVEKSAGDLSPRVDEPGAARNWLFAGSSVISGTGTALVCRTGLSTEIGSVGRTLAAQRPPDAFEAGVRRFGYLMLRFTVFLVLFVLVVNAAFHRPWLEALLFALALAVGLTPELLPMVVTVTLANGARRMAARRVIVKRLAAIHNLGAMDVLCTDKTGTLTESHIRLVRHLDASGAESERVLRLAYINSVNESGLKSPLDEAIIEHGAQDVSDVTKIDEVPFDFERRRVSVLVEDALQKGGCRRLLVVKGAPEDIIALSSAVEQPDGSMKPCDEAARALLVAQFEKLGSEGFRVLGVAFREMEASHTSAAISDETELTFSGFAAFIDPPKKDAADAIAALGRAGVDVKILTGDNERITRHVCAEIGVPIRGVMTGAEMSAMSGDALAARLSDVNLFCRVTPQQKERILTTLKRSGHVAGFLGDGINDASALHAADVGISVDTAADVAREAADLVLLEHDLSVVHEGVMEGRRTVANVTKYILMGASSNFGNMFSMAGAALFLPFLPMLPTQVLLNNLLYDVSEVGVPFDEVDAEALAKPAHWDLSRIQRFMLVLGPVSSLFDFMTFFALLHLFGAGEKLFQTGWFIESLATQALVIFVIRTRRPAWASRPHPLLTALSLGVVAVGIAIPLSPLGALFGFVTPPVAFFMFLIATVAAYLALVEVAKRWC